MRSCTGRRRSTTGIELAGETWLVVDEGETRLGPGDVVIQRGTNHAWSNRTEETARMAFVLVDGSFPHFRR
jgi:quercetin dioxygenase-like cupin family protein